MKRERAPQLNPTESWHHRWGFDVQEFSAAGVRTFAVVEGRPECFPVIFLHGTPGGSFIWAPIISVLGRNVLSIAPDLPGWGRSISSHDAKPADLSPDALPRWLEGIAAAHSLPRFDLVTHGNGAWLALELLSRNPALIRRLAFVSPVLREIDRRQSIWPFRNRSQWTAHRIKHWLTHHAPLAPDAREQWLAHFISTAGKQARDLPAGQYLPKVAEYRESLQKFRGAILLIRGKTDLIVSSDHVADLAVSLDRPQVHEIQSSGFFPTLDQSAEAARLFQEFLVN